ncbi:MAG: hypothetical protein H0U76_29975, partial [Ktedonobacteraceae bacterium]|nr:hypothetical protein [Ktedonobacteraceae bacterium]
MPLADKSADVGRAGHDADGYYGEEKAYSRPAAGTGIASRGRFANGRAECAIANAEQDDGDDDGHEDEAAPRRAEEAVEATCARDQDEAEGDGERACVG